MSPVFTEKNLRFEFDDESWHVVKYDAEPIYQKKIKKLDPTKAVDFIGVFARQDCFFVEVKDYRMGSLRGEGSGMKELALLVALKVRDSIAGVVGAQRTDSDPRQWQPFVRAIANRERTLRVVLWAEEPLRKGAVGKLRQRADVLCKLLKQQLRWLTPHVIVTNCQIGNRLSGLLVTHV